MNDNQQQIEGQPIPKMSDELVAKSDLAALQYGRGWGASQFTPDYDTSSDLTLAFEAGQRWMYSELTEAKASPVPKS